MNELTMAVLWKHRRFHQNPQLTTGELIQIISTGIENTNAGADFQHARVRIDGIEWIGAVELHVKSSDWHLHQHDTDKSYENVILHVVWEDNQVIQYEAGKPIPTLCLSKWVDKESTGNNQAINHPLACHAFFESVHPRVKDIMRDQMIQQRLQSKYEDMRFLVSENKGDWEEAFYISLAKSFGFSLNAEPMLRLARNLPLKLILLYRDRHVGIEAALFGIAGLLDEPIQDEYQFELRREYIHLKKKHTWPESHLQKSDWKMLRLRPANFPQIRLAQFAEIIRANCALLSLLLEIQEVKTLQQLFEIPLEGYWSNHVQFGKKSAPHHTRLGTIAFQSICINTLIPMLICYSRDRSQPQYEQKALRWLRELHGENNQITRYFSTLGLPIKNARDSQACLHWYRNYCEPKKCLQCTVGQAILTPT
jgi:hypothetical protein